MNLDTPTPKVIEHSKFNGFAFVYKRRESLSRSFEAFVPFDELTHSFTQICAASYTQHALCKQFNTFRKVMCRQNFRATASLNLSFRTESHNNYSTSICKTSSALPAAKAYDAVDKVNLMSKDRKSEYRIYDLILNNLKTMGNSEAVDWFHIK